MSNFWVKSKDDGAVYECRSRMPATRRGYIVLSRNHQKGQTWDQAESECDWVPLEVLRNGCELLSGEWPDFRGERDPVRAFAEAIGQQLMDTTRQMSFEVRDLQHRNDQLQDEKVALVAELDALRKKEALR
jgi:hypothetical protein